MKLRKNLAISETGFVFDPETGDSYSLNPIGIEIIDMLKEEKELDEISMVVLNKYEVDSSSFEKYYYDFIKMLEQYQFFEEEN